MLADIISNIQESGMFSLESVLTIAIEFLALLLIIPAIKAAIASQPHKLTQARSQAQIESLENELKTTHQNYLEQQQKIQHLLSEKAALHQEGFRLHEELQQQRVELSEEFRTSTFEQLQTLLTNYPSIHQMSYSLVFFPLFAMNEQSITAIIE
ncbi:hypothetical protein [Nostoc sp.]|uniref:hypothetical protein n=1 Tax=Nostoc sp. TaxID=1180 RepID=UPI002FF8CD2F